MALKSEKFDLNTVNQNNLSSVVNELQNQPPKGSIKLDKNLLPSRGKFYPNDIWVKKLTTLNIKNLATITENNVNQVINNVIASCLYGIDSNQILIGDKVWLIFYLRSFTYNDLPFNMRGECEHCKNITNYKYVLNNLKVSYFDTELPEYIELSNGDKITIKFPTLSTESAINRLKNDQNVIIDINPELLELSSYIFKVNDKQVSLYSAYEYICNMDAMDFSKFTNEMTEYIFSAQPYAVFECPTCGEEVLLPMSFTPAFFLPKI